MKMTSFAFILALAFVNGPQALAYCRSGNPLDLRCTTSDFLNPTFGSVAYYMGNGPARWAQIQSCTHPNPYMHQNQAWCAAAMQAQRITTGAH